MRGKAKDLRTKENQKNQKNQKIKGMTRSQISQWRRIRGEGGLRMTASGISQMIPLYFYVLPSLPLTFPCHCSTRIFLSSLGLPFQFPFERANLRLKYYVLHGSPLWNAGVGLVQSHSAFSFAPVGSSAVSGQVAKPVEVWALKQSRPGTHGHWLCHLPNLPS